MRKNLLSSFLQAVNHKEPDPVPVAIWVTSPFVCSLFNVKVKDYHLDPQLMLETQLALQREYPGMMLLPGAYPEFGTVVEASSFGCEVVWFENDAPYVKPAIKNLRDVVYLKPPNPQKDGLMPRVLEGYRYLWNSLDKRYIDNYGYLDGVAFSMGPIETAALIVAFDNFLISLYDYPDLIHQLLDVVTDSIILWIKAQEEVNGKIKRLFVADHMPHSLSSSHFEEFFFPYLLRIFKEFPDAIKLYHNEGNVLHVLDRIGNLGADIFHFGVDISEAKRIIGDRVCLMGNLDPVNLLLRGTPQQVLRECKRCISIASPSGGYLLSSAGGLAPGTPRENLKAIIDSVKTV